MKMDAMHIIDRYQRGWHPGDVQFGNWAVITATISPNSCASR